MIARCTPLHFRSGQLLCSSLCRGSMCLPRWFWPPCLPWLPAPWLLSAPSSRLGSSINDWSAAALSILSLCLFYLFPCDRKCALLGFISVAIVESLLSQSFDSFQLWFCSELLPSVCSGYWLAFAGTEPVCLLFEALSEARSGMMSAVTSSSCTL